MERSVDIAVVGAGFAGMYMIRRAQQLGLSIQVFEAGDDVGGTWYWNLSLIHISEPTRH